MDILQHNPHNINRPVPFYKLLVTLEYYNEVFFPKINISKAC